MKARTSETRLLKNGQVNPAFIDKPVPLVHKGTKVGTVGVDGQIDLPGRGGNWFEYVRAGDIERELKMNGAHKVFHDNEIIAVVVRERR